MTTRAIREARHRCLSIAAGTIAALGAWFGFPGDARSSPPAADSHHEVDTKPTFGSKGTFEVGGAVSADWTPDLFVLDVGPRFGYFIVDRWELSAIFDVIYENARNPDGTRTGTLFNDGLLEPSYHPPLSESIAAMGGLGVGYRRENEHTLFELAPRVGLNFLVGSSAVLTPAITVPILIGDHSGSGSTGVTAGVIGEVEIGVAW